MRARAGLALLLILLSVPARADDVLPPRTISVTGEGEVKVPPDLAVVSFAVETTAPEAAAAVAENARKSASLSEALKKVIAGTDKVSTTGYSLDPVYDYQQARERTAPQGPPRITGYVARNQVRVESHTIDKIGTLIDAATKAGANRVDGLEFTLEEKAKAQSDALKRAGEDARRQADAAAAALGVALGRVASATTASGPIVVPRPYQARFRMAAAAEADAPTPVEAGDVTVRATLQVSYEIADR
jgi:uncharacterized protein YggE